MQVRILNLGFALHSSLSSSYKEVQSLVIKQYKNPFSYLVALCYSITVLTSESQLQFATFVP